MTDKLAGGGVRLRPMIEIELPCCEATAELDAEAETIRCEACGIEHVLAPDARPLRSDDASPLGAYVLAA